MLFVYPTETCYGLGCSAFDKESIKKIYKIKKRDSNKPLIILVNSIKMWKSIAKVSKKALKIAEDYWPGALTIVQPKKKNIPEVLTKDEVAVRWSPHPVPNALIKRLNNTPIVSTSANLSGGKNPYKISDIPYSIIDEVDEVIDNGKLIHNPPSTVIKVINDEVIILRRGSVNI